MIARPSAERFGARFRAIRESYDMSQGELAKRSGVDRSFISRVELGTRRVSIEALEDILRGLGADPTTADTLRIAAGFTPKNRESLYPTKALGRIAALYTNPRLTSDQRAGIEHTLTVVAHGLEQALRESSNV